MLNCFRAVQKTHFGEEEKYELLICQNKMSVTNIISIFREAFKMEHKKKIKIKQLFMVYYFVVRSEMKKKNQMSY